MELFSINISLAKIMSLFWRCFGLEDLKKKTFYRDVIIEFIATGCLVFAIGMMVGDLSVAHNYSHMHVALGTGFTVTTIVWAVGSTSGGLIDPAISICCFLLGRIQFIRCVVYIASQCTGALGGAYLARSLGPDMTEENKSKFIMTLLNPTLNPLQGVIIEMVGTGIKSIAVFATLDANRGDLNGSGPLAIGISCMVALMYSVPYTGCSINPARSFGPAFLSGNWNNHWIYWVGPISGAIIGALSYEFFCKTSEIKTRDFKEKNYNRQQIVNNDMPHNIRDATLNNKENCTLSTFRSI